MSRTAWLGLALYVVWMSLLLGGLFWGRRVALREYAGEEAHLQWQEFREDMQRISEEGPVQRRAPSSAEPPALRLMRDHFPISLGAALLFGSLLYAMLYFAARGAFTADLEPRA